PTSEYSATTERPFFVSGDPGRRTAITSLPLCKSASRRRDPMKPLAPVISTLPGSRSVVAIEAFVARGGHAINEAGGATSSTDREQRARREAYDLRMMGTRLGSGRLVRLARLALVGLGACVSA